MQASCALPATCPSAACAAVFVPFMDNCATMLATMPGVPVADFQSFAASCAEMQAGAGEMLQPVAVQMFRVLVNTEGAAQAGAMFPGGGDDDGGDSYGPPLDPLQPLPPVPPSPPDPTTGETGVEQYHAECTSSDVASCVPLCNVAHHGFELLATIDGTDTKFSCNLAHGLYSWVGAASDGGYIGTDFDSFFSSIISGAAGTYMVTLTENRDVHTDLTCQPGQTVVISGDRSMVSPPTWGSGGFAVGEAASLSLSYLQVDTIIQTSQGALALTLDSCVLTFTNVLVLRVATARLLDQVFQGGILIDSTMSIAGSSATFAQNVTMGITVRSGAVLTLSETTLATEANEAGMLHVDVGGMLTVQSCHMLTADGSVDPLPCDGVLPLCASEHDGAVSVDGEAEVRTESPLVCDVVTGECNSVTCPPLDLDHGTWSYDNPARIFGTVATAACDSYYNMQGGGDNARTCQIDGSWTVSTPECRNCCGGTGYTQLNQQWRNEPESWCGANCHRANSCQSPLRMCNFGDCTCACYYRTDIDWRGMCHNWPCDPSC